MPRKLFFYSPSVSLGIGRAAVAINDCLKGLDDYQLSAFRVRTTVPNLSKRDLALWLGTIENRDHGIHPELGHYDLPDVEAEFRDGILFNHGTPDFFLTRAESPIAMTYWDNDRLKMDISIHRLYNQRMILVPSTFGADYLGELLPGKKVIPTFVPFSDSFLIKDYKPPKNGPFTFLHVGYPVKKSNFKLVVEAFQKVFGSSSDYRLILKSYGIASTSAGDSYPTADDVDWEWAWPEQGNIEVALGFATDEQMTNMYKQIHCLVHPSMGEGWGLTPYSTIGSGIPTICTNATGCAEFAKFSIPLTAEITRNHDLPKFSNMPLASVSLADLCDRMEWVANNYPKAVEKTKAGSKRLRNTFTESSFNGQLKGILSKLK